MSARKRPPRRKVKLKYPDGAPSADLFGTDPDDSARLLELRQAIDMYLVWPSGQAQEDGEYVAAVKFSGSLARQLIAGLRSRRKKASRHAR